MPRSCGLSVGLRLCVLGWFCSHGVCLIGADLDPVLTSVQRGVHATLADARSCTDALCFCLLTCVCAPSPPNAKTTIRLCWRLVELCCVIGIRRMESVLMDSVLEHHHSRTNLTQSPRIHSFRVGALTTTQRVKESRAGKAGSASASVACTRRAE